MKGNGVVDISEEFFVCKECGVGCIRERHFDAPFCNTCMRHWEPRINTKSHFATVSRSTGDHMIGGIWDNITRAYEDNG